MDYEYKTLLEMALNMPDKDWEELMDRRRIWRQVDRKYDEAVCWEWLGCKDHRFGYGAVNYRKKSNRAHVVVYLMERGEIPPGYVVRHTCDNKGCVNPSHLELGTHLDNTLDRIHRQNDQRGENNYAAKLTAEKVSEIRRRVANGEMQKILEKEFGLSAGSVSQIVTGWTWKDGFVGKRKVRVPRTLTREQLIAIKTEYDPTIMSLDKVAKKYGTSRSTVSRILIGDYGI